MFTYNQNQTETVDVIPLCSLRINNTKIKRKLRLSKQRRKYVTHHNSLMCCDKHRMRDKRIDLDYS